MTARRPFTAVVASGLGACLALSVTSGVLAGPAAAGPTSGGHPGPDHARGGSVFQRLATFPVYENSPDPSIETVAEITAASTDGRLLISTDSPNERVTFTDITNPRRPRAAGALDVGGEPTSVAVYRSYALIAVNTSESNSNPSGELLVLSLRDRSVVNRIDLGGQPDSVAVSPTGSRGGIYAAIAIENERDEDVNDGEIPQLPGGFVVTLAARRSAERLDGRQDRTLREA